MKNKEDGHGRPCFYSLKDNKTGLYWLVPISSKVEKYKERYNKIISKNGYCNTFVFAEVMGKERVFLIQNICPVSEGYIVEEYINPRNNLPVGIDVLKQREITEKTRQILSAVRRGYTRLVYPNILEIERILLGR